MDYWGGGGGGKGYVGPPPKLLGPSNRIKVTFIIILVTYIIILPFNLVHL